ncbi:beta-xylosidase XynB [Thermoanaerobacterium sp. PSU-2]|uniref:GH39 family glycosyl hydrolase n=1 Tax=Thermoanaerobacterium sp. PSU-2 TaxID=1930849 RepID=UPI000A15B0C6|nr:helix-turn-helix domain-containing protein [Thermoanaerobacterium sp. PSU-2]ORX23784.1 beta-xylosidase XynB [Thermoanaerobacterium sp. PSU-2]
MDDNVELIKNDVRLPIKIYVSKIGKIPSNIQKNIEFIFVLKGEVSIILNNECYKLIDSDVALINNGDSYEINGTNENLILFLQIDYDFFNKLSNKDSSIYLCNTCIDKHKKGKHEEYDAIRKVLAKIMYEYSKKDDNCELKIMSLLYELIYLLNRNFLITTSDGMYSSDIKNNKYSERMNKILKYIKQNYNQQISLYDVAKANYLTPEYLSKFFKKHMNLTFTKYLAEIRLGEAVKELIQTDHSVTEIAMKNGFPNLASFNKIFKEKYDTTPAHYRNEIRKKQQSIDEIDMQIPETIPVKPTEVIKHLKDYIEKEEKINAIDKAEDATINADINIDLKIDKGEQIFHTWNNMINLGYASNGLRSDFQQHLIDIQKTIKFKYARFQGIFSEEMLFDTVKNKLDFDYNFTKIDKLIDFIYDIGMRPFIEIGIKAKVLNITPEKIIYYENYTINYNYEKKEYFELLKRFIEHCIRRYGIDEVSQWYFEIWKEGEKNYVIWDGSFSKYMAFFKTCYNIIKQLVPDAKVGGPGLNPEINLKWIPDLLKQWSEYGVHPDFFSVVLYPYQLVDEKKSDIDDSSLRLIPSTNKDFNKYYLNKVCKILKTLGSHIPEVHVTEWNSTISHRHPANDTTFKAAYIIKNIVDNLDNSDSFGYWYCSDLSGELNDSKALLYGDMGLISRDGIRKPGFFAYWMLSRLGNMLIKKGEGYIITKKSDYKYVIITYNYKHFDYFYCLNEDALISMNEYYDIFENYKELVLNINMKGVKDGRYRVKKYILNRKHGSILDEWIKMNAIYNLKNDEINYLKQICIPRLTIFYLDCKDELRINSILEPHEINLYEIEYDYES